MRRIIFVMAVSLSPWPSASRAQTSPAALSRQVFVAESSFAASFAQRDTTRFATFLSSEAIFFGKEGAMRGKAAVIEGWRPLLSKPAAPFSWRPEVVEVLPSGRLALTSGPVHDPSGRKVGVFNSIWRREQDGTWRVVFDKGAPVCDPEKQ